MSEVRPESDGRTAARALEPGRDERDVGDHGGDGAGTLESKIGQEGDPRISHDRGGRKTTPPGAWGIRTVLESVLRVGVQRYGQLHHRHDQRDDDERARQQSPEHGLRVARGFRRCQGTISHHRGAGTRPRPGGTREGAGRLGGGGGGPASRTSIATSPELSTTRSLRILVKRTSPIWAPSG